MSEPIKVGDLVVVVKPTPCCGSTGAMGEFFRVGEIVVCEGSCNDCGVEGSPELCAVIEGEDEGAPLSILRRIPPLAELEGQRTEEDLREPA